MASNAFDADENIWYLDTSRSNHLCGKNELFSSLDESIKSLVKYGNNANIPILEKGQISIKLNDGSQIFISNVFYAPTLHYNLLSMGTTVKKGYNIRSINGIIA